jgi:hypothetical protein
MNFYERMEIGMQSVPEAMIVGFGLLAVLCFLKALAGPIKNHSKPMEHKVIGKMVEHDGFSKISGGDLNAELELRIIDNSLGVFEDHNLNDMRCIVEYNLHNESLFDDK